VLLSTRVTVAGVPSFSWCLSFWVMCLVAIVGVGDVVTIGRRCINVFSRLLVCLPLPLLRAGLSSCSFGVPLLALNISSGSSPPVCGVVSLGVTTLFLVSYLLAKRATSPSLDWLLGGGGSCLCYDISCLVVHSSVDEDHGPSVRYWYGEGRV